MIFEKTGLSAWITDSEGDELPEYQVQQGGAEAPAIQCWVPSTEGTVFQIWWEVLGNPHPELDLVAYPYLDGVAVTGEVHSKRMISQGRQGVADREPTGPTTSRLYEFGKRELTDKDTGVKLNESAIKSLNTIRVKFVWGTLGKSEIRTRFGKNQDMGPIHEKAAKKGHSGAAKLGRTVSVPSGATSVGFTPAKHIKPVMFVFNYAPEDWLQARGILPHSPEPESQDNRGALKRERSTTPDVIDLDDVETDDDEIQIVKHMIPAPGPNNKRQRTERRGSVRPKEEEQ